MSYGAGSGRGVRGAGAASAQQVAELRAGRVPGPYDG